MTGHVMILSATVILATEGGASTQTRAVSGERGTINGFGRPHSLTR